MKILFFAALFGLSALAQEEVILTAPWSGDYWPTYLGGISVPYADPIMKIDPAADAVEKLINFGRSSGFISTVDVNLNEMEDFYDALIARHNLLISKARTKKLSKDDIDTMSATEKLDLYFEDMDFTFTKDIRQYNSYGRESMNMIEVNVWEGLCHGWAAASVLAEAPLQIKRLRSVHGNFEIKFYPSDIKALLTHKFSKTSYEQMLGVKCSQNHPKGCGDLDPETFIRFLRSNMRERKRHVIVDLDPGYAVWNQPVYSYRLNLAGKVGTLNLKYGKETPASHDTIHDRHQEISYKFHIRNNTWASDEMRPDFAWVPTTRTTIRKTFLPGRPHWLTRLDALVQEYQR